MKKAVINHLVVCGKENVGKTTSLNMLASSFCRYVHDGSILTVYKGPMDKGIAYNSRKEIFEYFEYNAKDTWFKKDRIFIFENIGNENVKFGISTIGGVFPSTGCHSNGRNRTILAFLNFLKNKECDFIVTSCRSTNEMIEKIRDWFLNNGYGDKGLYLVKTVESIVSDNIKNNFETYKDIFNKKCKFFSKILLDIVVNFANYFEEK